MLKPLSRERSSELKTAVAECEKHLVDAAAWLTGRGINRPTAERFHLGVVASDHPNPEFRRYAGRMCIPGIGPNGVYSVRFRALDGHEPKMMGLPNTAVRPFNVRALAYADDYILITEGEIDAITAEQCGLPAVGFTGVSSWQRWSHRLFEGFPTVYVVADNDEPGLKFAEKVATAVPQAKIVVPGSDGQDLNDLYVQDGLDGVLDLLGMEVPAEEQTA